MTTQHSTKQFGTSVGGPCAVMSKHVTPLVILYLKNPLIYYELLVFVKRSLSAVNLVEVIVCNQKQTKYPQTCTLVLQNTKQTST